MKISKLIAITILFFFISDLNAQSIKSNVYRLNNVIMSKDPADIKPPLLEVSDITVTDANNNNRIDANEQCYVTFTIINKGRGNANNINVLVANNSSVTGLVFDKTMLISKIEPEKSLKVKVPVAGNMNLTTGQASLKFSFDEAKGFPPDAFDITIETKEFAKPDVKIVDHSFLTDNGEIKIGYPIQLKVLVRNLGQGVAENVNVSFKYPQTNVFPNDNADFNIGTLQPGDSKELLFEFQANKLYIEKTIPITMKITEKYGKFSQNKEVVASINAQS